MPGGTIFCDRVMDTTGAIPLAGRPSGAVAIAATRNMTFADSGGIYTVAQSSTYTINLPDPTVGPGLRYLFMLISPGSFTPLIATTGASTLTGTIVNDVTSVLPVAAAAQLNFITGVAAAGDWIECFSISTTSWFVRAVCSANGGITAT